MYPESCLQNMPIEILGGIFENLDAQHDFHSLMLTHPTLSAISAYFLYQKPSFASTYRFQQFSEIISKRSDYANQVLNLDLSNLRGIGKHDTEPGKPVKLDPIPGWRDWKYRHHFEDPMLEDLFCDHSPGDRPLALEIRPPPTQPTPVPNMSDFHTRRDIPLGGLRRIISCCKKIRHLNLTAVELTGDYVFTGPGDSSSSSGKKDRYLSDYPPYIGAIDENIMTPLWQREIVDWIMELEDLETVVIKKCPWFARDSRYKLMAAHGFVMTDMGVRREERETREQGELGEMEEILRKLKDINLGCEGILDGVYWSAKNRRTADHLGNLIK